MTPSIATKFQDATLKGKNLEHLRVQRTVINAFNNTVPAVYCLRYILKIIHEAFEENFRITGLVTLSIVRSSK
jgi:hypothetical protein